jgi:uncharacterized protein (TIGR02145 family)
MVIFILLNAAVCSSSITNLNFVGKIEEAGVCWSTGTMPSTLDAHSSSKVSADGTYTVNFNNLNSNTAYVYRHYVINEAGISYGDLCNFKTYSGTVQDFDNNTYFTIEIGSQVWLAQNLRVKHYADGTPIANITNNNDWYNAGFGGSYCYYENKSSNEIPNGLLYDYNAVMNVKSLAIPGWHVPSQSEFLTLFNNANGYLSYTSALKCADPGVWSALGTQPYTTGFNGYPSGYREYYGNFYNQNGQGTFWTTTVDQSKSGYLFSLIDYNTASFTYYSPTPGASVRLVKN